MFFVEASLSQEAWEGTEAESPWIRARSGQQEGSYWGPWSLKAGLEATKGSIGSFHKVGI